MRGNKESMPKAEHCDEIIKRSRACGSLQLHSGGRTGRGVYN
jgi:hypothetical protein